MVKITGVERGSRAWRSRVRVGDYLTHINDNEIRDVLDYRFYLTETKVTLTLLRNGKRKTVKIKKDEYDDIGLSFESALMDEKQHCKNGCIFCFIDQNPSGLRDTIYFKDDDSRLSFLHGNYVTLTNMTDEDVARIIKMRISPVNISVHTTNPDLRVKMMKNKRAGEVLKYLDEFYRAGISMCGQIVLCRGVNDGEELIRSMRDLAKYEGALGSVSIVPAGLTAYREGLYPLSDFTPEEAGAVIDMVDGFEAAERTGSERMFFVADEFYLKAGRRIPTADYYCDFPQIENGVGMIRSTSDELERAIDDYPGTDIARTVSIATGVAAYPMISDFCARLMAKCPNLKINVYKIINHFFGESITVAGLLTGRDISAQLAECPLGDELLIPENALREGEDDFLCGMTLSELSASLGVPVRPVGCDGCELCEALLGE